MKHKIDMMRSRHCGVTIIELLFVVAMIAVLAAIAVPNFLEAQVRSKLTRTRTDMAVTASAMEHYWCDYAAYPPNLFDIAQVHGISDLTSATIHLGGLGFSAEDYKSPINPYRKNKPADHAESDFMAEPFPGMEMSPGFYWGSYGKTDDRKMAASWEWDWLTSVNALSLRRLTTPMPYLPRICLDVFKSSHGGYSFQTGNADNYSLFPREYGDAMRCDLSFNYLNLQGLPEPERTYRGRARLYLLVSYGPYTQISHLPPSGREYIVYDPTNGTVSPGGLILFGPSDVASKINTEHGQ